MNSVVQVFKTDITSIRKSDKVSKALLSTWPGIKVNFDLEDCDRVLRVESPYSIDSTEVIDVCKGLLIGIEVLE